MSYSYRVSSASRGFIRWYLANIVKEESAESINLLPIDSLQSRINAKILEGAFTRETSSTYYEQWRAQLKTRKPRSSGAPDVRVPEQEATVPGELSDNDDAATIAALRRLLAGSGSIDPDTVRAIVAEELAAHDIRPASVHITVGTITTDTEEATHQALPECLAIMAGRDARGKGNNLMLVGPAGSGKTTLCQQIASALGLAFYYTGSVLSKYDLLGHTTATGGIVRTPFRDAVEHGGLFCMDDFDGSDPRALVPFNAAIENGLVAFPDSTVKAHANFRIVATANTWGTGATSEYVGRNKLDEATLSRYVKLMVDYDESLERSLVGKEYADWAKFVQATRAATREFGIKKLITPRMTLQGARCLAAGLSGSRVADVVLYAGMDSGTVAKLQGKTGGFTK
jgi:hypothetical protein